MKMGINEAYEKELSFLQRTLARCQTIVNATDVTKYDSKSKERIISPYLDVYDKVLDMYLRTLREYRELNESLKE